MATRRLVSLARFVSALFLTLTLLCLRAGGQSLTDNFDAGTLNPCYWSAGQTGSGSSLALVNQQVEITHAAGANGDLFSAGLMSVFKLSGDFDAQVDFRLLDWPTGNGVRVGMGIPDIMGDAVERTSFGSDADATGQPREVYLTHLPDGVQGIVPTTDLSGQLRLVRSGAMISGYYWDNTAQTWVLIHTGPGNADDVPITLSSWSHDYAFTGHPVRLAFDNFQINSGQILFDPNCVPEPGSLSLCLTFGLTGSVLLVSRQRRRAL